MCGYRLEQEIEELETGIPASKSTTDHQIVSEIYFSSDLQDLNPGRSDQKSLKTPYEQQWQDKSLKKIQEKPGKESVGFLGNFWAGLIKQIKYWSK